MTHVERGLYRALKSSAGEQFFWSGSKHAAPRPFTLWLEPIITVAALGRLHWDHYWPIDLIGTQSSDWAFDLVAYRRGSMNEYIAGEVKKSEIELERLIDLMKRLGRSPDAPVPKAGRERNAYKKVEALRSRKSPIFWAVGPAGYNHVFSVAYGADSIVELIPAGVEELKFKTNTA